MAPTEEPCLITLRKANGEDWQLRVEPAVSCVQSDSAVRATAGAFGADSSGTVVRYSADASYLISYERGGRLPTMVMYVYEWRGVLEFS